MDRERSRHAIRTFTSFAHLAAASLLAAALAGCVDVRPLDDRDLAAGVAARGASVEVVAAALASADAAGLALDGYVDAAGDPAGVAYWRARAFAFALPCVEARRRFQAERERLASNGLPLPIEIGAEVQEADDGADDGHAAVGATLDVLGLLDVGPAAAAEALADARLRAAFGALERAAWASLHEVDRACARVAAERARVAAFEVLVEQVDADARRIAILAGHGRQPSGELAAAEAMARRAARRLLDARRDLESALEELSRASGLVSDDPAFDAISPALLGELARVEADALHVPDGVDLLARLPRLRARRLDYATAEAALRRAAAEGWPTLRAGPSLRIEPDPHLLGGIVGLSLPWPGSVRGEVAAAIEERELAREALEDELRDALATAAAAAERLAIAREFEAESAPSIADGTAAAWRATRARFAVDSDLISHWVDTLGHRLEGATARIDAAEAVALARIDLREAIGPAPSADSSTGGEP